MGEHDRLSLQFAIMLMVALLSFILTVDFLIRLEIIKSIITGIQSLDKAIISFILKSFNKNSVICGMVLNRGKCLEKNQMDAA